MAAQPPKGAERDRAMCSARGPSSARAGKRASRERSEFGEKPKSQRRRSAQPPALPSTAAPYVVYFFGDMVKFEAFEEAENGVARREARGKHRVLFEEDSRDAVCAGLSSL